MNVKDIKKIRQMTKRAIVIYLREKPRFIPRFLWAGLAKLFFTPEGYETLSFFYARKGKTIKVRGVKYKIKDDEQD